MYFDDRKVDDRGVVKCTTQMMLKNFSENNPHNTTSMQLQQGIKWAPIKCIRFRMTKLNMVLN